LIRKDVVPGSTSTRREGVGGGPRDQGSAMTGDCDRGKKRRKRGLGGG